MKAELENNNVLYSQDETDCYSSRPFLKTRSWNSYANIYNEASWKRKCFI